MKDIKILSISIISLIIFGIAISETDVFSETNFSYVHGDKAYECLEEEFKNYRVYPFESLGIELILFSMSTPLQARKITGNNYSFLFPYTLEDIYGNKYAILRYSREYELIKKRVYSKSEEDIKEKERFVFE